MIPVKKVPSVQNGTTVMVDGYVCGNNLTIPVTKFEAMFGAGPYTYEQLSASAQTTDSWKTCFDAWKAQGIIT